MSFNPPDSHPRQGGSNGLSEGVSWFRHNQGNPHSYPEAFLHVSSARKSGEVLPEGCLYPGGPGRFSEDLTGHLHMPGEKAQERWTLSVLLQCSAGNTGKGPFPGAPRGLKPGSQRAPTSQGPQGLLPAPPGATGSLPLPCSMATLSLLCSSLYIGIVSLFLWEFVT